MLLYLALGLWLVAVVISLTAGKRKLPLLSLAIGGATVWIIHQGEVDEGQSILAALAVIVFLGSKLAPAKVAD